MVELNPEPRRGPFVPGDELEVTGWADPEMDDHARAVVQAVHKLRRIIAREGDADGARRRPEYFDQILQEIIQEQAAAEYTERRFFHGRAEGAYSLPQPH